MTYTGDSSLTPQLPQVKENFEAKLSEATESGKVAIAKAADDVDSIQSKLSSALEENKEKKAALASEINELLASLREKVSESVRKQRKLAAVAFSSLNPL